ncbi:MAG: hypothetical protein RL427_1305 [Bacteroidota bacterium]|jgi:hypothetical protein
MTYFETLVYYLKIGFTHVLPFGFDHVLFVVCLFFFNPSVRNVVLQCSLFTLAHSLTLVMVAYGLLLPHSEIIEPLITFSILIAAVENIIHSKMNSWRLVIIFAFGLVHGLGIAAGLLSVDLPRSQILASVLSFNLGVEVAQIAILYVLFILVYKIKKKHWYTERVVYPISSLIACTALYWTIIRILN